jgi:hypothetical protein
VFIIHEDLDMRKPYANWVSKCLNDYQNLLQWCQSSEKILDNFLHDPNEFLSRLLPMEETWLYDYNAETKQQSMEWRHNGSNCPQNIPSEKYPGEFVTSFLGSRRHAPLCLSSYGTDYQRGILLISAGAIEGRIEGKMPWEFHKGGLFMHDNCLSQRALATEKKLS